MKKLIIPTLAFISMLILMGVVAFGQTTDYKVDKYFQGILKDTTDLVPPFDSIRIDSLFHYSYSIITVSENERDTTVQKSGALAKSSVQAKGYSNARTSYDRIALLERQIDELYQERNASLGALNAIGINDYNTYERERVRKNINGRWRLSYNGQNYICDIKNDSGALRIAQGDATGKPLNELVGRVVPRSRRFFIVNLDAAIEIIIGESVNLYSSDADFYKGEDSLGNVMRLKRIR